MIRAGNGLYDYCADCGQLVKLNKWLFGSLHSCLSDEERRARFAYRLKYGLEGQAERNRRMGIK